MIVCVLTLRLHVPWVHSLKEKRMEVKSLLAKLRNKFNIAAAEADEQDSHAFIVIQTVALAADNAQADSIMDNVLSFVEDNTEAEIFSVERERR